jgi:hypothetical protein
MHEETIPPEKVLSVYSGEKDNGNLSQLIAELFAEQLSAWHGLADSYQSLEATREREINCNGYSVHLRYNPLRKKSTMAAVDKGSIRERPCFLCVANLPENQKGILYRDRYLILCNPMPALHSHITIASIDHRPQCIEENFDMLFQLMTDLGSAWTILYNGPGCGASAPDHHHFQAVPSGILPIEYDVSIRAKQRSIVRSDGIDVYRIDNVSREVIVLNGKKRPTARSVFQGIISHMKEDLTSDKEPMMSIAGIVRNDERQILIFPRSKHRPEAFFRQGEDRIVVSPAIIEMCGVVVTPVERDFQRLTADDIETIYGEVSKRIDLSKLMF